MAVIIKVLHNRFCIQLWTVIFMFNILLLLGTDLGLITSTLSTWHCHSRGVHFDIQYLLERRIMIADIKPAVFPIYCAHDIIVN